MNVIDISKFATDFIFYFFYFYGHPLLIETVKHCKKIIDSFGKVVQLCVIGKGGNRDPISMKDRKSLFIFVASKGYMYSYIDANTNREE